MKKFGLGTVITVLYLAMWTPLVMAQEVGDMQITVNGFTQGGTIPDIYTCTGDDHSPAMQWGDMPQGTKRFALIVDDPDAPRGTFVHWVVYDIPANMNGLESGIPEGAEIADGMRQGINGFGKHGYGGPCPPHGHGVHHYHFKLYALDVDQLSVPQNAGKAEVEAAIAGHILAQAEYMGTYERQ